MNYKYYKHLCNYNKNYTHNNILFDHMISGGGGGGGECATLQYYDVSEGNAESVMTGRCGVFICKVPSCEELLLLVMVVL